MPHIHEKIDFTVEVFIVYKNQVLLKKHDKYGMWLSVGGHAELDEDPNQAAIREVQEEVGLTVTLIDDLRSFSKNSSEYTELIPPFFMNRHKINDHHEHITLTYFATSKSDHITQQSKHEKSECRWFTKEEIETSKEIRDSIKYYALSALKKFQ